MPYDELEELFKNKFKLEDDLKNVSDNIDKIMNPGIKIHAFKSVKIKKNLKLSKAMKAAWIKRRELSIPKN